MKQKLWISGIVVVSLLFFTSCGDDGGDDNAVTVAPPSPGARHGGGNGDDNGDDNGDAKGDGAAPAIDVTGTWIGTFSYSGPPVSYTFDFVRMGDTIAGMGTMEPRMILHYQGEIDGNHLVLQYQNTYRWDLIISGDTMTGTFQDLARGWTGAASFTRQ